MSGNNPYVITVGAMSDNYTPADPADDVLASFSSAGPTVEGFVKPDLVAPGDHMVARSRTSSLFADTPLFQHLRNFGAWVRNTGLGLPFFSEYMC